MGASLALGSRKACPPCSRSSAEADTYPGEGKGLFKSQLTEQSLKDTHGLLTRLPLIIIAGGRRWRAGKKSACKDFERFRNDSHVPLGLIATVIIAATLIAPADVPARQESVDGLRVGRRGCHDAGESKPKEGNCYTETHVAVASMDNLLRGIVVEAFAMADRRKGRGLGKIL